MFDGRIPGPEDAEELLRKMFIESDDMLALRPAPTKSPENLMEPTSEYAAFLFSRFSAIELEHGLDSEIYRQHWNEARTLNDWTPRQLQIVFDFLAQGHVFSLPAIDLRLGVITRDVDDSRNSTTATVELFGEQDESNTSAVVWIYYDNASNLVPGAVSHWRGFVPSAEVDNETTAILNSWFRGTRLPRPVGAVRPEGEFALEPPPAPRGRGGRGDRGVRGLRGDRGQRGGLAGRDGRESREEDTDAVSDDGRAPRGTHGRRGNGVVRGQRGDRGRHGSLSGRGRPVSQRGDQDVPEPPRTRPRGTRDTEAPTKEGDSGGNGRVRGRPDAGHRGPRSDRGGTRGSQVREQNAESQAELAHRLLEQAGLGARGERLERGTGETRGARGRGRARNSHEREARADAATPPGRVSNSSERAREGRGHETHDRRGPDRNSGSRGG